MGTDVGIARAAFVVLLGACASRPDEIDMAAGVPGAVPVEEPRQDRIRSEAPVLALSFSRNSRYLGRLTRDELDVWDVVRDESVWRRGVPAQSDQVIDLATRTRFAVVDDSGVQIRDLGGRVLSSWPRPGSPVELLRFDDPARRLAAVSEDGSLRVWSIDRSAVVRELGPQRGWQPVPGPGFGVLYAHGSGRLRVLDLGRSGTDRTIEADRRPQDPVAVAFEGKVLALVNSRGEVEIRRLPDGGITASISGLAAPPQAIALSPDGSLLAAASASAIELRDTRSGERLERVDSKIWSDGGLLFSPDGFALAWIERDRKTVRYWSPLRGLVEWHDERAALVEPADTLCKDVASAMRYLLAGEPYLRGVTFMQVGKVEEARRAFSAALKFFPEYPGLLASVREADEHLAARTRAVEVQKAAAELIAAGDLREALRQLDRFVARYGHLGDHGVRARAVTVRSMLEHFDRAEAHRRAGEVLDAVVEFDLAVGLVPELAEVRPEYRALRQRARQRLQAEAEAALSAGDDRELLRVYGEFARLGPLTASALMHAGSAHERLGEIDAAVEAWRAIDAQSDAFVAARRNIARVAGADGDPMQAKVSLARARLAAPDDVDLAAEYAAVLEQLGDLDEAVAAWKEVGRLVPQDPAPYQRIGDIETRRGHWRRAGSAYHEAARRSGDPRPGLLLKIAESFTEAGLPRQAVSAYLELLELADAGVQLPVLGPEPRAAARDRIRALGFVSHRGEWIEREQFLARQGWIQFDGEWVRPEEARLREIASLHAGTAADELRDSPDAYYEELARNKRVASGMTRQEVILAWGFFSDLNVVVTGDGESVFEQLLFENSRQVYLKNGRVCFWSE